MPDNTPSKIGRTERRRQAIELRRDGLTFAAIGAAMGITPQSAHELVQSAIREFKGETESQVANLRQVEMERMEAIHEAIFPMCLEGDRDMIDRWIKLSTRKAALLGLDLKAPDQTHQHVHVHAAPVAADASRSLMDQFREWAAGQGSPAALPSPAPDVIEGEAVDGPVA